MHVMSKEISKEPPQIGKLQDASESLAAPLHPNNCWKVFNYVKHFLVCCKESFRTVLGSLLPLRLWFCNWRCGMGFRWQREIRGFCSWVPSGRVRRSLWRTALILRLLLLLHAKIVFLL